MTLPKRFVCFLIAALLSLATAGSAQTTGHEPYKIGVTFPLTGPLANSASLYLPAAQIAVDQINKAGGINGHPLQLAVEDSQGAPEAGIAAMRKLVQVDGVQAILTIFTNVVSAQIPLAEQVKVPFLCTVETDALRNKSPWAFQHAATIDNKGKLFGQYWRDHNVKRVYGLVVNNSAGPFFSAVAKAAATAAGADYQESAFNDGDSDYRGLVARVKEYRPDGVYIAELGGLSGELLTRQLREGGVTALVYMPGIFYDEPAWRAGVGGYIGSIVESGLRFDPRTSGPFVADYRAKLGHDPTYQAGEQYDIIKMFAAAIARSSYNGEAIRNALATLKGVPSVFGGTITMDSSNYSVPSGDGLWQVQNGRLVKVL
jgi:branched-chain amino acid transport system substrate-binding protein